MDARAAAADYVAKIVAEPAAVKALLLDDETASILAVVASQSELLKKEVLLIDKLAASRKEPLPHMPAVVFVRPTADNILALREELRRPMFASYRLVFSNVVRRTYVEEIADADETEAVTEIHEFFADYFALDAHLLSFNVVPCLDAMRGSGAALHNPYFERTVDGISATLLALKRRPVVRYQASSSLCRNLAERVCVRMDQEASLFGFRVPEVAPLLLIVDRREDPVTPLLNQWTYEAMVHELIGISNSRVSLESAPNVPDDLKALVLDAVEDDFFRHNRFRNFGELGVNLKRLVDAFQSQSESNSSLNSIEDMMRFVGSYPEFRKASSNVSKHVALAGELSRLVGQMNLLEVSQLEQDLACREAEADHRGQIMQFLRMNNVSPSDKLRLVMLYSLRYEESSGKGLPAMKDALYKAGIGSNGIHLITAVKEYAGAAKRSGDVFSNRSFFAKASNTVRRGIGGVDNVYTQHEPLLAYTIDDLLRNRLKNSAFPLASADEASLAGAGDGGGNLMGFVDGPVGSTNGNAAGCVPSPREVIILLAGGATYEEAKCISGINGGPNAFVPPEGSVTASAAAAARQLRARIVLCGTCIHNSTSFAVEISRNATVHAQERFNRSF